MFQGCVEISIALRYAKRVHRPKVVPCLGSPESPALLERFADRFLKDVAELVVDGFHRRSADFFVHLVIEAKSVETDNQRGDRVVRVVLVRGHGLARQFHGTLRISHLETIGRREGQQVGASDIGIEDQIGVIDHGHQSCDSLTPSPMRIRVVTADQGVETQVLEILIRDDASHDTIVEGMDECVLFLGLEFGCVALDDDLGRVVEGVLWQTEL